MTIEIRPGPEQRPVTEAEQRELHRRIDEAAKPFQWEAEPPMTGQLAWEPEKPLQRVQIFTWEPVGGVERKWSVDGALLLIAQRKLRPDFHVKLSDAEEGLSRNEFARELDPKHIAKADLTQPVIFITLWDNDEKAFRQILIDGWHRLRKMVLLGRTEPLEAYILSPQHSRAVEIVEYEAADGTIWRAH